MRIDGDAQKFQQFFALLDNFQLMFNIVTPRGQLRFRSNNTAQQSESA
jgi:Alkyl sulfatase C-terminal